MMLLEDEGQKEGQHLFKQNYWKSHNIAVKRVPLPVGDYVIANDKTNDVIFRKATRKIPLKKMDFVGSYEIAVDTKKNITEIEGNICGKAHARFRDECILAQNNRIKLYVLIENDEGIADIRDLFSYTSRRRLEWFKINKAHNEGRLLHKQIPKQPPVSGEILAKAMLTMQLKYGVTFVFCKPVEAGKRVVELLVNG